VGVTVSGFEAIIVRLGRVVYVACFVLTIAATALFWWPTGYVTKATILCPNGSTREFSRRTYPSYLEEIACKACGLSHDFAGHCRLPHSVREVKDSQKKEMLRDFEGLPTEEQRRVVQHPDFAWLKDFITGPFKLENAEYDYAPPLDEFGLAVFGTFLGVLLVLETTRMILSYILFGKAGRPFWWPKPKPREFVGEKGG